MVAASPSLAAASWGVKFRRGEASRLGTSLGWPQLHGVRSFGCKNCNWDGQNFVVSPPHVKLYLESQLLDEGSHIVGPRHGLPQLHGECVEASSWFLHRAASWMAASLWQCSLMVIMFSGRVSAPG